MIDSKDLRVGNLVHRKYLNPSPTGLKSAYELCIVRAIGIDRVIVETKDKQFRKLLYDNIQPAPITEEILRKLGARKLIDEHYEKYGYPRIGIASFHLLGTHIIQKRDKWVEYVHSAEIQGLHHLQNLYYFTRGTELDFD